MSRQPTIWEQWATPARTVIALALLTLYSVLAFQFGPLAALSEWGEGTLVFDLTTDYRAAEVPAILEAYGAEGRALYLRFLLLDLLNPFLFGVAGAFLIASCLRGALGPGSRLAYLAWVPIAGGVVDLVENVLLLVQLQRFPEPAAALAALTRTSTAVKLGLVNVTFLVVAGSLLAWAVTRWARRRGTVRRSTADSED